VAIAGPLTSFAVSATCLLAASGLGWRFVSEPATPIQAILVWLSYINVVLAFFNLVPGYPLDGGRVLRAAAWAITGNRARATRIAARAGQVVALLLIGYGVFGVIGGQGFGALWLVFIGWFLLVSAQQAYGESELEAQLRNVRVADVMSADCRTLDGGRRAALMRERVLPFADRSAYSHDAGPARESRFGMNTLQRVAVGAVEIEYESRGAGEAIVFVHHGAGADWFTPLLEEPALSQCFRLVLYHRVGYAGSSALTGPMTFEGEAATFREFAGAIGITQAHIVGHSASGCMVLQFALDAPDVVHSVAVLEPALMAVPSPPDVGRALELYRAGKRAAAVETFLQATCGPDADSVVEHMVPGALSQFLADADTFFSHELPALRRWTFGPSEARRLQQPVLAVVSERRDSRFDQRQQLLVEWLPHVEPYVLANAGHLLHLNNPRPLAERLSAFCSHHPIGFAGV
jgi:pimeloyl-ACP methyl ester carboxylesterase